MDIKRAKEIIEKLKNGEIEYEIIQTTNPSPFAHNLILLGDADVILMKDRRKRLAELHERILKELS
jgi:ATP-dependent Lhr-like helicase